MSKWLKDEGFHTVGYEKSMWCIQKTAIRFPWAAILMIKFHHLLYLQGNA